VQRSPFSGAQSAEWSISLGCAALSGQLLRLRCAAALVCRRALGRRLVVGVVERVLAVGDKRRARSAAHAQAAHAQSRTRAKPHTRKARPRVDRHTAHDA
jgi:hypothetical protein